MSYYKIDKGIPLPNGRYPFADLDVGESFFVPNANANSVSSTASRLGKALGAAFVCRRVKENGVPGMRVWRVE